MSPDAAFRGTVDVQRSVTITADTQQVWDAVVDWSRHSDWVPMTAVRVLTNNGQGVGARFVGRTGAGPLGFDDVMEVTTWRPPVGLAPGRVDVVKQGRVLTGSAWFEVAAIAGTSPRRTRLTWAEQVTLAGLRLPWPVTTLAAPFVGAGLESVLRRIAADIENEARTASADE